MNSNLHDALSTILDFVERWNKEDKDVEAAEAARLIQDYLTTYDN